MGQVTWYLSRSPLLFVLFSSLSLRLLILAQAYVLAREFILGHNRTGLVTNASSAAIGGENVTLSGFSGDVLRAGPEIYVGSVSTTSTVVASSASAAVWESFIATRWVSSTTGSAVSSTPTTGKKNQ
jgi:carboxypeptidase D